MKNLNQEKKLPPLPGEIHNPEQLINHARLTIKVLTQYSKRRNYKGLKQWERELLTSAKTALGFVNLSQFELAELMTIKPDANT